MSAVPPAPELRARLARFRELLAERGLGGALITDVKNVRYLSGFTGDDSALLVTPKQRLLLTDFRYVEEAAHTAKGWRAVTRPPGLFEKAGVLAKKLRVKKLGLERHDMTLAWLAALRKAARGVKLVPEKEGLVGALRLTKSDWEIRQIGKALRIQEQAFLEVCALLKPGIREYEAAAELRYRMVRAGADDQAFDCMFQWGPNSSLPHGRPTGKRLPPRAIVLIDWGARCGGYHADLTRTFFIGKIPPRLRKIHEIVAEAQRRAVAAVAPGVAFAEVDRAARDVIRKAGYGKQFGHSTGHGLGLRIHEAPSLNQRAKGALMPGMVVTIEPGIYLPGLGGVRIEDDVLVTATGGRVLSRLPIGLRWNGAQR
ncbi:MAG: Xaa-Pro peptidase family protein [Planctomycetota bacterium]|nr:Xaa-Pro peptidase family protein [Planctomycetota bacterium]